MPLTEKREKHARLALIAYADPSGSNYPQPAATDLIAELLRMVIGDPAEQNKPEATRLLERAFAVWTGGAGETERPSAT
jgi:hypothetical protein